MQYTHQIAERDVASLRPYPGNARAHLKKQVKQIAASIERFGFTNPVLVSDDGEIIAGHGRVEAARLLGMKTVPTLALSHLSDAERRAYVLADNKLALNAGWEREILAIQLQALVDLEFDVEITGFSLAEIDFVQTRQAKPIPRAAMRPRMLCRLYRASRSLVPVTFGSSAATGCCVETRGAHLISTI